MFARDPRLHPSAYWAIAVGVAIAGVVGWRLLTGPDKYAQPTGTYVSVSAGASHACGVRTDGSVECWGQMNMVRPRRPVGHMSR